ncbi:Cytochrome b5 [Penicillium cf. griseofulvum]|uniref:Cytochrome b5 n=1 Tax=Penicillium cf. griseofulvum TaxID=2972120 RepID=A0A9W9JU09_9EURO|nr:Cytochrome b5 [Penicillium cf. griseofulvum]KAJ5424035.1 Cytochrome b5 [Penicillium cf. griseofulvum]KAJ5442724.1 Cytochrome b5 [Penicillium cf. griseofulvum]
MLVNNIPDSTIIQIIQAIHIPEVSFEFIERPIFLVVCRHAGDSPLDWDDTMQAQFIHRLTENSNSSGRLFGAIAIGKKVIFYLFEGKAQPDQRLARLHRDIFELEKVGGYAQVEGVIDYIKTSA